MDIAFCGQSGKDRRESGVRETSQKRPERVLVNDDKGPSRVSGKWGRRGGNGVRYSGTEIDMDRGAMGVWVEERPRRALRWLVG